MVTTSGHRQVRVDRNHRSPQPKPEPVSDQSPQDVYPSHCIAQLRQIIDENAGNALYCIGQTDASQQLQRVQPLTTSDLLALLSRPEPPPHSAILIHNHPSGDLSPTAAEQDLARELADRGLALHLVDNPVENIRALVDNDKTVPIPGLDPTLVRQHFSADGHLANQVGGYEDRPQQQTMARQITAALNANLLTVIEAGTGTGKSLAYLLPCALWAERHDETIVISTNTINLQQQLLSKDLPLLHHCLDDPPRAVLVKGRNNYLCLRRLQQCNLEPDLFRTGQQQELANLRHWAESAAPGSRDDLAQPPSAELWQEVCCEADQCPRHQCPFHGRCFFHRARRQASQANILVVNHALLLSDLAVRSQTGNYSSSAVLPPYSRVVMDEAHHLEDAATRHFSLRVSPYSFSRVLQRLAPTRKPERGLLLRWLIQMESRAPQLRENLMQQGHILLPQLEQLQHTSRQRFAQLCGNFCGQGQGGSWRLTPEHQSQPQWQDLRQNLLPLTATSLQLARRLDELLQLTRQLDDESQVALAATTIDVRAMAQRLTAAATDLTVLLNGDSQLCIWVEVQQPRGLRDEPFLCLNGAPINVASQLQHALYDRFRTVILTSATLSVGRSFNYFLHRSGLDRCDAARLRCLQLDSPFDFAHQAVIAIPTDLVEPTHPDFARQIQPLIERSLVAAGGNAFVLFTAYGLLRSLYNALEPPLQAQGLTCLQQGQHGRHQLLQQFVDQPRQVLFGTDSFWEGVDVPGDALQLVIITRLPFRVPTEPIQLARCEAISASGRDPFMLYTVPQAVIRLKQGFGRLIRHQQDRGLVLILDRRVTSRSYGRIFLDSLPPARRLTGDSASLQVFIQDFFQPVCPS